MRGEVNSLWFEGKVPSLEEIRAMAAERSGLEIEVMPSLQGKEGECLFYSEEIWQAVSIDIDIEAKRIDFKWKNGWQAKEYLRLVVVKCLTDLGGKGRPGKSFFRKKLLRNVAQLSYSSAKKLLFARLTGRFSLQLDPQFWQVDEAIQRRRRVG